MKDEQQQLPLKQKVTIQDEEPEYFDSALLMQPPGARLEYFEHQCLIWHPRLLETLEAIVRTICPPGAGASQRRSGSMVLAIGPSRVGKTTLIYLLEERLLAQAKTQMQQDLPTFHLLALPLLVQSRGDLTGQSITKQYCGNWEILLWIAKQP